MPDLHDPLLRRVFLRTWRVLSPNAGARHNAATALLALMSHAQDREAGQRALADVTRAS